MSPPPPCPPSSWLLLCPDADAPASPPSHTRLRGPRAGLPSAEPVLHACGLFAPLGTSFGQFSTLS